MARSRSPGVDDVDDYVRARQEQLVLAAYLVCGDVNLAEQVAESAFAALVLHRRRVGDDSPDTFVRRRLYREAMVRRVPHRPEAGTGPRLPLELAALSRRQRAAATLLRFEERTQAEAAEVLGTSVATLRTLTPATSRDLLVDAASVVGARDLTARARGAAERSRRRSRRGWMAGAAAVAVAGLAVAGLPTGGAGPGAPEPRPVSTTASATAETAGPRPDGTQARPPSAPFQLVGTLAQIGPRREDVGEVPPIDDLTRGQLGLPEVLAFGPRTQMTSLSDLGHNSAPVRAVLLRHTRDGYLPVLVRPTLAQPFVVVDTLPLVATIDEVGNASPPLEVTAVARDRRHVAFLQPGRVLVLDAYSGEVRTVPVPDRHLDEGGWAGDGLIVWSGGGRWRVSPLTGEARRTAGAAHPGGHRVSVAADDEMRVLTFGTDGRNTGTRRGPSVLMGTWQWTLSGPDGRFATGGFLGREAAALANARWPEGLFQGVFAAGDETVTPRLLIAPGSEGVSVGCCEVLGWAYRDEVLVRWHTTHLLMWKTSTGALRRVSTLPDGPGEVAVPGSPAAPVALAP